MLTRLLAGLLPAALLLAPPALAQTADAPPAWRMPPTPGSMPMLPQLAGARPKVAPYLPFDGVDPATLPGARARQLVALDAGDTLRLEAMPVRATIRGRDVVLLGYNGQVPGPLIRVEQDAEIVVEFVNSIDRPSTIHWHGIRIENRFDGVPGVTQEAVEPGETFRYRVRFPDAGIYWYHPHHREDVQQDLGLYGNLLVDPAEDGYWGPVHREEVVTLDDILVDEAGLFPYGDAGASHALMGRFGNVPLVNGGPEYRLEVARGSVVRFFLTNTSNTRTWNLRFGEAPMKLVAADVSRFEREIEVGSVAIAPAQRYVVEVRFEEPGAVPLVNAIQAIDHFRGTFVPRVDTLGVVEVTDPPAEPDLGAAFDRLRENRAVSAGIDRYRDAFAGPPEKELVLASGIDGLDQTIVRVMALDTLYVPPVEWNDAMPMMNWLSSSKDVRWILREPSTGRENGEIDWRFETGEVVKIRITNPRGAFHPMQHPIHLHGQRFLVVARDGKPNDNLVWKDTAVVPVGVTVDLLVEMSNPGRWMLHCHVSEHLEAGMKLVFRVEEPDP